MTCQIGESICRFLLLISFLILHYIILRIIIRIIIRIFLFMTRRKINEKNIRKLTKVGGTSYAVTIPIEIIKEFGWRERQKLVVKKQGKKIVIEDWKK